MSNWRVVDTPFPKVSFGTPDPGEQPSIDTPRSVDQTRALHKWINDVRHWVMRGEAGSDEELTAMLQAKGAPPEFTPQILEAYKLTEGMQDMGLNEPNTPQQVTPPEDPGVQPIVQPEPQAAPDPELGLPTNGGDTYEDQYGTPNPPVEEYEDHEDPERDADFYKKKNPEEEEDEKLSKAFASGWDYRAPSNPYDADNTPFGNRTIIGPGGQLTKPPQVAPKKDKISPRALEEQALNNDQQYIDHLVQTRGVTPEEADRILTEHANGNVVASDDKDKKKDEESRSWSEHENDKWDQENPPPEDETGYPEYWRQQSAVQKGSPYPENSKENAPDHSAEGHHLPDKVNQIYNAIMREHPEYGKEKAMKIAWERSGLHKEKDSMTTGTYNDVPGRIANTYVDVWGTMMARFATEFGTYDVPMGEITPTEDTAVDYDPVSEIERFLTDIDPAGSTPDSIDARMDNVNQVYQASVKLIREGKLALNKQIKLDEIALAAQLELGDLKQARKLAVEELGQNYLDTLPQFEGVQPVGNDSFGPGGSDQWLEQVQQDMQQEAEGVNFDQVINEQPELLVNEVPDAVVGDQAAVQMIAASWINNKLVGLDKSAATDIRDRFIERAELVRRDALANRKTAMSKAASTETYDGPDEGLFL